MLPSLNNQKIPEHSQPAPGSPAGNGQPGSVLWVTEISSSGIKSIWSIPEDQPPAGPWQSCCTQPTLTQSISLGRKEEPCFYCMQYLLFIPTTVMDKVFHLLVLYGNLYTLQQRRKASQSQGKQGDLREFCCFSLQSFPCP